MCWNSKFTTGQNYLIFGAASELVILFFSEESKKTIPVLGKKMINTPSKNDIAQFLKTNSLPSCHNIMCLVNSTNFT